MNAHLDRHPTKRRLAGAILLLTVLGVAACGPVRHSHANVGGTNSAATTTEAGHPVDDECARFACEP